MNAHPAPAARVTTIRPRQVPQPLDGRRLLARGLGIVGLSGIAVVHLAQLPGTWRETPGLGAMFAVVVLAAAITAAAFLHTDRTGIWLAASLVALAPIGGYVLTRSVAVPFDRGDVGNWLEPSALVAVFIEVSVLALCSYTLHRSAGEAGEADAAKLARFGRGTWAWDDGSG